MARPSPSCFATLLVLLAACSLDVQGLPPIAKPGQDGAVPGADGAVPGRDGAVAPGTDAGDKPAADGGGDVDAGADGGVVVGVPCADPAESRSAECLLVLSNLATTTGTLTPSFDPLVDHYQLDVSIWTESLVLNLVAGGGALLTINDEVPNVLGDWQSPLLGAESSTYTIALRLKGHPARRITVTVTRRAKADLVTAEAPLADDEFAHRVAVFGNTLLVGAPGRNSDRGAVDVFVRNDKAEWEFQAELAAGHGAAGDRFGNSIAISDDSVVIGAPGEDSDAKDVDGDETSKTPGISGSGAAYVFVRSGKTWEQEAYLKADHPGASDGFGTSVAIDGDSIVVGAPGEDSDAVPMGGAAPNEAASESGAVYVFARTGSDWAPQAYLKAPGLGSGDAFGSGVAIHAGTLVASAPLEDGGSTGVGGVVNEGATDSGAAYVFSFGGGAWSVQAYLKASNPGAVAGSDTGDQFGGGDQLAGRSVAIWENTIVVGAPGEDSGDGGINATQTDNTARDAGAVYVFVRDGVWAQQAYIKAEHPTAGAQFGSSVALHKQRMVVGAWREAGAAKNINGDPIKQTVTRAGAAFTFERPQGMPWTQHHYLKALKPAVNDDFGWSVTLWDDTVVAGARGQGVGGAAFVF